MQNGLSWAPAPTKSFYIVKFQFSGEIMPLAPPFEGAVMAKAMTGGVSYKIRVIQQHSLSQKSKIFASSLREGAKAASPRGYSSNRNIAYIIPCAGDFCKGILRVHILGGNS